jgi:8-oxo-dGTP diphosphatase
MNEDYATFFELPEDFASPVDASVCFCEFQDTLLYLQRHPSKWCGGSWNIPGGKLDFAESPIAAALRETYEETGILLSKQAVEHIRTIYLRVEENNSILHVFRASLNCLPTIHICTDEATDFAWKTVEEALLMPLIKGGKEVLYLYQEFFRKNGKESVKVNYCVVNHNTNQ